MKNVIISNKLIGETPLECLERVRIENNISKDIPMTYAGRLDPLAEGALVILVGEECKKKEEYLGLNKEYEIEILLGVTTDSYDLLGKITNVSPNVNSDIDFNKFVCKFTQTYPAYSSKIIAMKERPPILPNREVEIFSIDILEKRDVTGSHIVEKALERIAKVKGDFRQEEITLDWKNFLTEYGSKIFKIIKLKVSCSSGTYMRSLAYSNGGLAFSIKRTKIGEYSI